MKHKVSFVLNGVEIRVRIEDHLRLIDLLRDVMGMTGTKEGCGEGECGACTVLVNGQAVNSCLYPALEVEEKEVVTIEGLQDTENRLSAIQMAFVDSGAIQCGFCTPGMIMSAKALLDSNPDPSEDEIRDSFQGNLCRCTGYVQIIEAVKKAAQEIKRSS
ncbi:(2Fe-2S)-binding protein [Acidobacteriota bacterium]